MKAEEDAEEKAYNTVMGATSRRRRRCKAFQAGFDSSATTSSNYDSDLEELDSFDDSDSRDDEGEEEDKEEEEGEDMASDYP